MSERKPVTITDASPWYRVSWVWFLLFVPFTAVLFGIVMIVSANYQRDDLVVDNYYKEGMGINQLLQLDENAAAAGATVTLQNVTLEGAVFKVMQGSEQLSLSVFHVSDQSRDLAVSLEFVSDGIYTVTSRELAALLKESGVWYLEVNDPVNQWRLRKRINTPVTEVELVSG